METGSNNMPAQPARWAWRQSYCGGQPPSAPPPPRPRRQPRPWAAPRTRPPASHPRRCPQLRPPPHAARRRHDGAPRAGEVAEAQVQARPGLKPWQGCRIARQRVRSGGAAGRLAVSINEHILAIRLQLRAHGVRTLGAAASASASSCANTRSARPHSPCSPIACNIQDTAISNLLFSSSAASKLHCI